MELPHELRDYQRDAVKFALQHPHCIIQLPTGRGKTLTAMGIINEIARDYPTMKTLVLVPTTVLLSQWIEDGFKAAGVDASGVSGASKIWGQYTVSTYQSAIRNLGMVSRYDIAVFDEVHHLFSPEYSRILTTMISSGAKHLIGLTATVREYGEGMAMQNNYFPDVFKMTLGEFQDQAETRIPVKIEMVSVNLSEDETDEYDRLSATISRATHMIGNITEWVKRAGSSNQQTSTVARSAIKAYALQRKLLTEVPEKIDVILSILQHNAGQFIIFSDTIDGIKRIEEQLRANGITVGAIYSGIRPNARQRILADVKSNRIRVLVGGNAISEGVDVPDISNVILSSLIVKSTRTYVQRLGRVLRPAPNKHVRIYLVYAKNTLEERNALSVYDILGERR
jgi:superfamily II DNA or RNA helicase